MKTFIIAEIGINHNGEMDTAEKMIKTSAGLGANAVKFQKRSIDLVYPPEVLNSDRPSPWGSSYREQKEGLEFTKEDYDNIDKLCKYYNIHWFASAWDIPSQKFMRQYDLKYNKIASPMLTVLPLLEEVATEGKYTFISTGMSTMEEVQAAVNIFKKHDCPFELMHCVSSYPLKNSDANLRMIQTLRERFGCNVGYSGHEKGVQVSLAAVAMGATSIERHLTLDRTMYGSDQSASLEPVGFGKMVRDIRVIEEAMGDGVKKINAAELSARKKLASPYWYNNYE